MANLPETPTFDAGVYQIETSDRAEGGVNGAANRSTKNLANRTAYLKQRVDAIEDVLPDLATVDYVNSMLGTSPGPDAVQEFAGNGNWVKPAVGRFAIVELWGGGGSGSRGDNDAFLNSSSGGGGGEYAQKMIPMALLPASVAVVIGTGGAAKTSQGPGINGGDTAFGAFLSALGGKGGAYDATGAAGGGTLGDSHYGGGVGGSEASKDGGGSTYGGGGGGRGNAGDGSVGVGGISRYGGNGGAGGTTLSGGAGQFPGGGGGGAAQANSGPGGNGKCKVTVI